jgi:predicted secreted Zn-dependent protease
MHRLLPLAALALGCASSGGSRSADFPVPEGVTVDVQEETYAVFGADPRSIWDSMNRRGPRLRGRFAWGLHGWRFNWTTQWARTEGECRVADVQIEMSTEITMPDWRSRASAPVELREMWDEFERQLREHEDQHRTYALDAIEDLRRTILAARGPDCETVSRRIRAQTDVIMERYDELNRLYDERSTVTFPPRR